MKRLYFPFVFVLFISFNAIGQISGLNNMNQLQNITGINQLQNYLPNPAQLQMLGVDESQLGDIFGNNLLTEDILKSKQLGQEEQTSALSEDVIAQILAYMAEQDSLGAEDIEEKQEENELVPLSGVYGHDYFRENKLILFTRSTEFKAPDNYTIDSGDEINIAVFGYADYNANLKVNKEGFIIVPDFGRVYVKGLSFGAAKSLIRKRLTTFINTTNSTVEISLNYSRNITINIVGDVNQPGTYIVPAINSVYNVLNAAEGPNDIGSVRRIQVRRDGKTIKTFDIYNFLIQGEADGDFYLQDGDFIYVPTAEKIVTVQGSVRRPMKYELIPEENLLDLIRIAGGISANAYTKSIQVERFAGDRVEITDVDLEVIVRNDQAFSLKDGDIIRIPEIPTDYENFVSISGAVRFPGKYELKEGYRISDILKGAGGIQYDSYLDRAYLVRLMENMSTVTQSFSLRDIIMAESSGENIILQKFDKIEIFSKDDFKERFLVQVEGAVNNPRTIEWSEGLTLNDLIFYGGGLKQSAANNRIELSRVIHFDENLEISAQDRVVIETIEIDDNLEIDSDSKVILLRPMDRVFVRSIYQYGTYGVVELRGEVKYPRKYAVLQKDERILDLVERAGGFTPYAHLKSSHLYRKNDLIGDVILDLDDAMRNPDSRANHIMRPDDIVLIPTVNQMVSVKGAIQHPDLDSLGRVSSRYVPGKRAKYYVRNYGAGFAKKAKKRTTVVLNPNGSASYTKKVLGFNRYPKVEEGSIVSVDFKKKKPKDKFDEENPREPLNWNIILPSVIVSSTSVLTTTMLFILLNKQ